MPPKENVSGGSHKASTNVSLQVSVAYVAEDAAEFQVCSLESRDERVRRCLFGRLVEHVRHGPAADRGGP